MTIFLLQACDCIAFSALYGYYYLRRLSSPLPSFYYLSNTAGLPQGPNKEHINKKKGHVKLLPFTQIRNKVPLSLVTPEKSHHAAVGHSLVRKLIFSRGWEWAISSIRQSGTLLLLNLCMFTAGGLMTNKICKAGIIMSQLRRRFASGSSNDFVFVFSKTSETCTNSAGDWVAMFDRKMPSWMLARTLFKERNLSWQSEERMIIFQ